MNILFVLFLSWSVFSQTPIYSFGPSVSSGTDGKEIKNTVHMIIEAGPSGHIYKSYQCPEGKKHCTNSTMKLSRGKDFKWKFEIPMIPSGRVAIYDAKVTGDVMKVTSFTASGENPAKNKFSISVNFFENGSQWKTNISTQAGKALSSARTTLSNSDKKTMETALKGKKIIKL